MTCLVSMAELVTPKVMGIAVDGLVDHNEAIESNLLWIALFVVLIALLGALFRYLFGLINAKGAEKLTKKMRDELYSHIMSLPSSWHETNKTGDIIQRCTSDVDTIKKFLSEELTSLFRTIVMIILSLVLMLTISPRLTLIPGVFIPVVVGYSLIFHKKVGSAFYECDSQEGVLSSIAQENLTGVRVVRAFGREKYERERFMTQNEKYTGLWVRMMKILSTFWSSMDLIGGIQVLLVLALGACACVGGTLAPGDYVAFVSYNAILIWPVRELGRIIADMSKAGISIDRIAYIMNSGAEEDTAKAGDFPANTDIVFDRVSFSYEDGKKPVLCNVSLNIKSGTTVGILGKTGSGKSTLVKLLDGLYDLKEGNGSITIGGRDIRLIRREELRKNIGFVLQEPFLFSRTLRENICISEADNVSLKDVLHTAQLEGTVRKLDGGLDTVVGERGVTLSGGQKQRTAIAQTLMRKPPILIFDDSLSALDTRTDEALRRALKAYKGNATVILISHRITTLMDSDNIFVMQDGGICETGTHEELIKRDGLYRRIYELQCAGSENIKEAGHEEK